LECYFSECFFILNGENDSSERKTIGLGSSALGCKSGGVAREERSLADVVEAEIKHHHTLKSYTTSCMGRSTILEGVDVGLLDQVKRK